MKRSTREWAPVQILCMATAGNTHWVRKHDWDAVAGIAAAVVALILHLFHVVQIDILLTISLVLGAIILLRQLRHEDREERVDATTARTEQMIAKLQDAMRQPDLVLIGPRHLRSSSQTFAHPAQGEIVWFNVCLLNFSTACFGRRSRILTSTASRSCSTKASKRTGMTTSRRSWRHVRAVTLPKSYAQV